MDKNESHIERARRVISRMPWWQDDAFVRAAVELDKEGLLFTDADEALLSLVKKWRDAGPDSSERAVSAMNLREASCSFPRFSPKKPKWRVVLVDCHFNVERENPRCSAGWSTEAQHFDNKRKAQVAMRALADERYGAGKWEEA